MTPAPSGATDHPELAQLILELVEQHVLVRCRDASTEQLAETWVDVKGVVDSVAIVCRELENQLAARMKSRHLTVEGLGTFEKMPATTRKAWDHRLLAHQIVQKALDSRVVDEDTGEVEDRVAVATRALLETCGISYWRVGEVKKYGIDPDEYCEKEYGSPRVKYSK